MLRRPACAAGLTLQADAALLGELEGVGQQVLEHLQQALGIGDAYCGRGAGRASI